MKRFCCLLILLPLSAISTVHAQEYYPPESAGIQPSEPVIPTETDDRSQKIIGFYLNFIFSGNNPQHLTSLYREGTLFEGQKEFQFEYIYKFPFKFHFRKLRSHLGWDYETQFSYNGKYAWSQEVQPDLKSPNSIGGFEAKELALEANLPLLLHNHKRKGYVFEYQGEGSFAERRIHIIKGWLFPDYEIEIYFDQESFLILNYRVPYKIAGRKVVVDRMPIGMKKIESIWMPTGYDFRYQGKSFKKVNYSITLLKKDAEDDLFNFPKKTTYHLGN